MTRADRQAYALGLGFLLVLALRCCGAQPAHAQDDALLTARVCFSETALPRECAQIAHATAERAVMHGHSYRDELVSYSPRATGRRGYGARSWIASLHPDRIVAASLAERMNRETVRVRFAAMLIVAWRTLYAGEVVPCPGATEWGARWCRACRRRMRAAGYAQRACNLSNAWFAPHALGAWSGADRAMRGAR